MWAPRLRISLVIGLTLLAGCTVNRQRRRWVKPPRTAIPIAKLPTTLKAPAGKISLLTGELKGGTQTLYLVNRGDSDVHLATQDQIVPAVLEFKNEQGEFQAASRWQGSSCGNSYFSVALPVGHYWVWGHPMASAGQRAEVRIRLLKSGVFMGERDVLDVTGMATAPTPGHYSPDQVIRMQYTVGQMLDWPADRLLKTMRGEGLPAISRRHQSAIRADARRAALHHKLPRDKAIAVLPAMVNAPKEHTLLLKNEVSLALRRLCRADRTAGQAIVDGLLRGRGHPNRRHLLKSLSACDMRTHLRGLLKRVDDPDIDVVVERLNRSLKYTYTSELADALAAFANDPDAPDDLRADVRKALKKWGRHQVKLTSGPGRGGAVAYNLDIRSERAIEACAPYEPEPHGNTGRVPCTAVQMWGKSGWVLQRRPHDESVTIGPGPRRFSLEGVMLPKDLPLGTYCVEATPVVRVEGLAMPTDMKVVEYTMTKKGVRRRNLRPRCPIPKPTASAAEVVRSP